MYKLLLCWRYLKTRYIALASIISVMLGVATLIAVNAVMKVFAHETQDRDLSSAGVMNEGLFASWLGLPGIPREAEAIPLERDLLLARLTGGAYHAAKISTGCRRRPCAGRRPTAPASRPARPSTTSPSTTMTSANTAPSSA